VPLTLGEGVELPEREGVDETVPEPEIVGEPAPVPVVEGESEAVGESDSVVVIVYVPLELCEPETVCVGGGPLDAETDSVKEALGEGVRVDVPPDTEGLAVPEPESDALPERLPVGGPETEGVSVSETVGERLLVPESV
jgi:hypothetical protein